MTRSLEGKIVIVTGASSGVGEAAARAFAQAGATVVLAARSAAKLERLARSLDGMAVRTDVTRRADLEGLVEKHPWIAYRIMRAIVRFTHGLQRRMSMQSAELMHYLYKNQAKY